MDHRKQKSFIKIARTIWEQMDYSIQIFSRKVKDLFHIVNTTKI